MSWFSTQEANQGTGGGIIQSLGDLDSLCHTVQQGQNRLWLLPAHGHVEILKRMYLKSPSASWIQESYIWFLTMLPTMSPRRGFVIYQFSEPQYPALKNEGIRPEPQQNVCFLTCILGDLFAADVSRCFWRKDSPGRHTHVCRQKTRSNIHQCISKPKDSSQPSMCSCALQFSKLWVI